MTKSNMVYKLLDGGIYSQVAIQFYKTILSTYTLSFYICFISFSLTFVIRLICLRILLLFSLPVFFFSICISFTLPYNTDLLVLNS